MATKEILWFQQTKFPLLNSLETIFNFSTTDICQRSRLDGSMFVQGPSHEFELLPRGPFDLGPFPGAREPSPRFVNFCSPQSY